MNDDVKDELKDCYARIERLEAELLGEVTEHSRRRMQVDNQADRIAQLEAALRVIRQLPNVQQHYGTQITELIDAALEDRT